MSSDHLGLRWRSLLIAAGALFVLALGTAPAYAKLAPATKLHSKISYVPAFGTMGANSAACGNGQNCSPITYHSGGIVQHTERLVPIYWVPAGDSIPAQFELDVNNWIKHFAGLDYTPNSVFSATQQYYDLSGPGGAKRFVPDGLTYGSSYVDTDPYPASGCTDQQNSVNTTYCFTQSQEASEVQSFVSTHHLTTGRGVEYLLFTAQDVGSCFDSTSSTCAYTAYCAYHSSLNSSSASGEIVWANEPWEYQVTGCDLQYMGYGAGYPSQSQADPEFSTLSHEISETMTDLNGNAWFDASGNEIGDKCAYNYNGSAVASWTGLNNNGFGYYNQVAGGTDYLMQYEFSDENSNGSTTGCVGKIVDKQPTITGVTPTTATRGTAQTFTAQGVTTPAAPLAYITWSFNDGTAPVTTTTTSVSHTYPTTTSAGTKKLVMIVTDGRGNEKRLIKSITVS